MKIISAHAFQSDTGSEARAETVSLRKENGLQTLTVVTGKGLLIVEKASIRGQESDDADEFLRDIHTYWRGARLKFVTSAKKNRDQI